MNATAGKGERPGGTRSQEILEQARKSVGGGASSTMRVLDYHLPLVVSQADGPYLWDADGNRLIDLNMGYGPLIFGHRPRFVIDALHRVLDQLGTVVGFPHELSHQVAELVKRSFPSIELLRYASSGTEAVQTAVRLARAHTGRELVVLFEGHYHGSSHDVFHRYHAPVAELDRQPEFAALPGSAGLGAGLSNARVLPWNDTGVLADFLHRHGDRVAALLMEPVMGNSGVLPPREGYLEAARALADRYGALLVLDEVISGYRVARGGAQERFGVAADITLLSKALNGGMPVTVVGAGSTIFQHIVDGTVFHGGVYSGNPLGLAAAYAVQCEFDRRGGEIFSQLERRGAQLVSGVETIFAALQVPVIVQRVGAMMSLWFATEPGPRSLWSYRDVRRWTDFDRYIRFQHELQRCGVYVHPNHFECWFLSTAHSEAVINDTLDRIETAARRLIA